MNLLDMFAKVVSKRPMDTSVAAARLNRLIGQNRILPGRNAKIQGNRGFWICAKASIGAALTQAQYDALQDLSKIIDPAFDAGTKVYLVLDQAQQNVRELFFFSTGSGKMNSLNLKSFSLIWKPASNEFDYE